MIKKAALKSAFDKHEPGSHQKMAFDTKVPPPAFLSSGLFSRWPALERSETLVWSRTWGLSCHFCGNKQILAIKVTVLERAKVPFQPVYQPMKECVLCSKCSVYGPLWSYSYCLPFTLVYRFTSRTSSWLTLSDKRGEKMCKNQYNNLHR